MERSTPSTTLEPTEDQGTAGEDCEQRLAAEPIAIVGMSCRFPGADDIDAYWDLLVAARNVIADVPPERWDVDALYDPDPDAPGRMSTRRGGFLSGIDRFDAAFFNISPREAAQMDPQQRLLLEVIWEALENASLDPDALRGTAAGVFVGICASDYARMAARDPDNLDAYWGTGNVTSVAAGRISYTLGLTGPCIALDTACSSALVAIHYACESLRAGECDTAFAASANLILSPDATIAFSKARMMSPDGLCRTFDARADGYVRSEGAGAVVLKTLARAREDGDEILALIRGNAINQDGASGGLTVPNGPAQTRVVRGALARAGLEPRDIDVIEAHGTGTPLGDPIEVGALAEVFARGRPADRALLLGSVKSLVGHLEVAAGMAGLIKLVLAMRHRYVPGYRELGELNERIDWQRLPFEITREGRAWPETSRPARAGISGFGFSGTNAHLILEEAPARPTRSRDSASVPDCGRVLCLSARSEPALRALAGRYADRIGAAGADLDALTHSANAGRARWQHRLAVPAHDAAELRERLAGFASTGAARRPAVAGRVGSDPAQVAFLFSGQGAQYAGMGRELYELHPAFRADIDQCERLLAAHLDTPLRDLLWGPSADWLNRTVNTQPALFALEYALARLWQSWGVQPTFVVGHSVGEFAAACIAGVLRLDDAIALIAARGRLMQRLPPGGAMAALPLARDEVEDVVARLGGDLAIAACNDPRQTVISGSADAVAAARALLAGDGGTGDGSLLDVSHAFHSPLMEPMVKEFGALAAGIAFSPAQIAIVSTVTGTLDDGSFATADYWARQITAPVDFAAAASELQALGANTLLEIGPGTTLVGLARECGKWQAVAPSLRKGRSDWYQLLETLGTLFVAGVDADGRAAGRTDRRRPVQVPLPTYPFQRQRHWFKQVRDSDAPLEPGSHPLLGRPLRNALLGEEASLFERRLRASDPAYLAGHRVHGRVVMPGAGFVEMAFAGYALRHGDGPAVLRNFAVRQALALPERSAMTLQSAMEPADGACDRFACHGSTGDGAATMPGKAEWTTHCSGDIGRPADDERPSGFGEMLADVRARLKDGGRSVDPATFYAELAARHLAYGPSFRTIRALDVLGDVDGQVESLADIALADGVADATDAPYRAHPTLVDGCFQALAASFPEAEPGTTYLPVGIDRFCLWERLPDRLCSHAVVRRLGSGRQTRFVADIRLLDPSGRELGTITGLQAIGVDELALLLATAEWRDKLYETHWIEQQTPASEAIVPGTGDATWLIVGRSDGIAPDLASELRTRGHPTRLIDRAAMPSGAAGWDALLQESAPVAGVVAIAAPAQGSDVAVHSEGDDWRAVLGIVQGAVARGGIGGKVWTVTCGAQAVESTESVDPTQAALWGLARSIRLEQPALAGACIDLEPDFATIAQLADDLVARDAEPEIAYRIARRHVARLRRLRPSAPRGTIDLPDSAWRLRTARYGTLDALKAEPVERAALKEGEVEIAVRAAAVNFKDVMYCMGMLRQFSEQAGIFEAADQPLGFECAGVVSRVGDGVGDLSVGDPVFGMAPSAMASHVVLDARMAYRKPEALSFAQAASLPTVFMTALYALDRLAQLRPGQTMLLHAGAGGVGQAAIQVARRAGATVYATASPWKWPFLKSQGVAATLHSRTLEFADEIMRLTEGRGVDVVLNSLNGEHIARSADVVARDGCFIEIGKAGVWDTQRMADYRPDIRYFLFDLGDVEDGALQAELLQDAVEGLEAGFLAPLPTRTVPAEQADAAFRHLAQARNIGKVVLAMPEPVATRDARPRERIVGDRSYLVTGGCGALGLRVAERLVERGARRILLAGRGEPDEQTRQFIDALRMREPSLAIRTTTANVADRVAVDRLIAELGELGPPGGIVHAAGVLDDALLADLTEDRFAAVLRPKVEGGWNLHRATRDLELDFFMLFSSIAAPFGAPGQAAYAFANAYLEGLARHRRAQGLPATAIHWGPWAASGMAARTRAAGRDRFDAIGLTPMAMADNLDIFDLALEADRPALIALDIDWARYLQRVPQRNAAFFGSLATARAPAQARIGREGGLAEKIANVAREERVVLLADDLCARIATVAGLSSPDEIAADRPMAELGLDSLMAVELKNGIEAALDCVLPATLLLDHPTLADLAAFLADQVAPSGGSPPERPRAEDASEAPGTASQPPRERMRESMIAVDGRRLQLCTWEPDGTRALPVVCVHGILDQGAIWDAVADSLAQRGHRVLAPDLRGHGRSDHHPAAAAITAIDLMRDVAAVIEADGAPPYVLVGHSAGSAACGLYAALHPEKVAALVLVEPVVPCLRQNRDAMGLLRADLEYRDDAPAHPVYPDVRTGARMLGLSHPGLDRGHAERLAERILEHTEEGWRWRWDPRLRNPLGIDFGMTREQYLHLLATIDRPVHAIFGSDSQFATGGMLLDPAHEAIAGHGATIAGGHNLHTDNPDALAETVLAMIDERGRSDRA